MKPLRVQKYGGTSVASVEKMQAIAQCLQQDIVQSKVVVVVSAMGNTTDTLVAQAREKNICNPSDVDAYIAQGDLIAARRFQSVLAGLDIAATVMGASDIPIRTNANFGRAMIEDINPQSILQTLSNVDVVVVPGFQGTCEGEVTTLGRGGSDLTAVALSVSLGVAQCEIYTDVPGVMTTDPKLVPGAQVLANLAFDDMIALAYGGARVLQPRCVVLAKRYQLLIYVASSTERQAGTYVGKESEMENVIVSGIALASEQVHAVLSYPFDQHKQIMQDLPQFCSKVLRMRHLTGKVDVEVLLPQQDHAPFLAWHKPRQANVTLEHYQVAAVTVVGTGLMMQKQVFFDVQDVLMRADIDVLGSSMSDDKICFMVPDSKGKQAVRAIHAHYGLEKEPN